MGKIYIADKAWVEEYVTSNGGGSGGGSLAAPVYIYSELKGLNKSGTLTPSFNDGSSSITITNISSNQTTSSLSTNGYAFIGPYSFANLINCGAKVLNIKCTITGALVNYVSGGTVQGQYNAPSATVGIATSASTSAIVQKVTLSGHNTSQSMDMSIASLVSANYYFYLYINGNVITGSAIVGSASGVFSSGDPRYSAGGKLEVSTWKVE